MTAFRVRSLRGQLALLGTAAVLVPLMLLVLVVGLTSSSEEVLDGDREALSGETVQISSETSTAGVPDEVLIAAVLLAIGAMGAVWWWAGRAVAPMASITKVADEIQGGSLEQRIGLTGAAAEVQALGDSFDRMLDRLGRASTTQQRLIEDASHELRTPLTALAVNNEVILEAREPTIELYRESAQRTETLIARLQTTLDDLLVGARQRQRSERQVDNDLMAIVRRVVAEHRVIDPNALVEVTGPDELRLGIDGPSIHRAIANLIENACRYSPADQPIEIAVTAGESPQLSVTDYGPGIDAADLDSVFDRYYRVGSDGGSGIGLALVKQVADAHGRIEVASPPPGRDSGTRFTFTFTA